MELSQTFKLIGGIASNVGLETGVMIANVDGGVWLPEFSKAYVERRPLDPTTATRVLECQAKMIGELGKLGISINPEVLAQQTLLVD